MRSGRSKIANDKIMAAALKDNWRVYKKNGGNSKKPIRFFFITKFESTCHLCKEIVPKGVKAMIRPAINDMPKLFCCYDCSAPWRGDDITPQTYNRQQAAKKEQEAIDYDNRIHLNTSGHRDDIYKALDDIYNSNQ